MFFKRIIFFLILGVFYQNPLHSKSNSLNDFDGNNLSKYFSGIVALENKDNSRALKFLSSSKILLNKHNPYLKKYVYSLVLEDKVSQAINVVKRNLDKENSIQVLDFLFKSIEKDKITLIMATHNDEIASRSVKRVALE